MKMKPFLKIEKPNMDLSCLQWSINKNLLAFSDSYEPILSIWDIEKKNQLFEFKFQEPIIFFQWFKNNLELICSDSSHIYQVKLKSSEIIKMNSIPPLINFSFSEKDNIAIGINSSTLYVFNTSNSQWKLAKELQLDDTIELFSFNQRRKIAACYYRNNIKLFDINLELKESFPNQIFDLFVIEWDSIGNSLFFGDYYANVIQWEIDKNEIIHKEKFIDKTRYNDYYYDSSEATLYFEGDKWFPKSLEHYYDPKLESLIDECINHNFGEPIHDIKFHPSGKYYAIAPNQNKIYLLGYPENSVISEISKLKDKTNKVVWNSDGKYLAVYEHKNHINTYKLKNILKNKD